MTILVFSDSHGEERTMLRVIRQQAGHFDAVFHLGDGVSGFLKSVPAEVGTPCWAVSGNCDVRTLSGVSLPPEWRMLELDGVKISLCHGHRLAVKGSTVLLEDRARAEGAEVALFGHTHIPCCRWSMPDGAHTETASGETEKPLLLCNPGSISRPQQGRPTYGVLELRGGAALFGIAEV